MGREHRYSIRLHWSGNTGSGTESYRSYKRDHVVTVKGKPPIAGSSDPGFRGDPERYNPEELLVGALSGCHMLWYLHLASESGVIVTAYEDDAEGKMIETANGGGRFTEVLLRPRVVAKAGVSEDLCRRLHERAHELCFIANSVNFPVRCEPTTVFE
jgi:organic hydroperoxide reductase OsmC/OhrA